MLNPKKISKITPDILLLKFDSREELCTTMLRFQEHYESDNEEFRNRPFTVGEYRSWYSKTKGAWTYKHDWSGFNLPIEAFYDFRLGLFDPLTKEESQVLDILGYKDSGYIIALADGDPNTLEILDHEVCHGLYQTNEEYHDLVYNHLLTQIEKSDYETMFKSLQTAYGANVVNDEIQAYLSSGDGWFDVRGIDCAKGHYHLFQDNKKRFYSKLGIDLGKFV